MAQFDVYRNPNTESADDVPYLVDVQSDMLRDLATRIVVPLTTRTAGAQAIPRLEPAVTIGAQTLIASVPRVAAVRLRDLGEPVGSLAANRGALIAALDVALTGI